MGSNGYVGVSWGATDIYTRNGQLSGTGYDSRFVGWLRSHRSAGSGDGQAPPARNAADDAAFPNPRESIQGAEGVLPATAPAQRTPGAVDPRQLGPGGASQHANTRRQGGDAALE